MKVCLVTPRVGTTKGAFLGGSTNNVVNLSRELAKRHEIHLVTTPPRGACEVEGIDWCHVHQLYTGENSESLGYGFEFLVKAISGIIKLHKTERIDIVNTHSGNPKLGLVSGIAGKICNVPSVHTQYTPIVSPSKVAKQHHPIFSNYALFSNPGFSRFYFSNLDCVTGVSKNVAESVSKVLNKEIKVIPPCLDASIFSSNPSLNHFRLNDKKVILFLGDREVKGISVLVEAMREVNKRIDVKIIVVAGFEKESVKSKIGEIQDSVTLLGIVDMPSVLAVCDIFVAPVLDTFDIMDPPLSILEAMAAGKPVIASHVGSMPEIIKHEKNGILVKPNKPDELAEAIISLLGDVEKRGELGKNAYNFVSENFSPEKIGREYEKLYERMLVMTSYAN